MSYCIYFSFFCDVSFQLFPDMRVVFLRISVLTRSFSVFFLMLMMYDYKYNSGLIKVGFCSTNHCSYLDTQLSI